jgi:hypothetical protein
MAIATGRRASIASSVSEKLAATGRIRRNTIRSADAASRPLSGQLWAVHRFDPSPPAGV